MNQDSTVAGTRRRSRTPRLARAAGIALAALFHAPTEAGAQAPDASAVERADASRALGAEGAPVLIYEISDFECEYCARFALDVLPQLDSAYIRSGRVRWVFVNLPLPFHARAWNAAEAALCAGATADRFWPMHRVLFARQEEWAAAADPSETFARYAAELDIPVAPFRECVAQDDVARLILRDVIYAASQRVAGAPAYLINRERVEVGVKGFEDWRGLIESELRAKARRP